ncbi:MAG: hypothetical protein AAF628_13355 [Planctomycetota bacterium]
MRSLLIGILLVALVLRVSAGLAWGLSFDAGYHLFVAKADSLHQFLRELSVDSHPPLHYVLLRWLPGPEITRLGPRLPGILADVGTVAFVAWGLRWLRVGAPVVAAAAFTLAISHAETTIAVVVRSYALATLGSTWAAIELVRLVGGPPPRTPLWSWSRLVLAASLACWSLYASVFVLLAIAAAVVLTGPAAWRGLRAAWQPLALIPVAVAGLGLAALVLFFSRTIGFGGNPHVGDHYPQVGESPLAYLARGTANDLGFFTPLRLPPVVGLALVLMASVACVGVAVRCRARAPGRAVVLLTAPLLWLGLAVAGWLGVYPFGGELRHQHVLLVPWLVAVAVAADGVGLSVRHARRWAVGGVLVATVVSGLSFLGPRLDDLGRSEWRWRADCARLAALVEPGDVLYLTPFNGVAWAGADWSRRWRVVERYRSQADEFSVDSPPLTVLRPQAPFSFGRPPTEAELAGVAADLRRRSLSGAWVLALQGAPVGEGARATDAVVAERCISAALQLRRRVLLDYGEALLVAFAE